METEIRNIGIFSHVDAGKTSITEQFLYHSAAIRSPGDVNKGTATTDSLSVEKERGVSVKSADVSFLWKGKRINLIDSPGHPDFSAEVAHTMQAIDAAILIISAVEGVQSHTYAIADALKKHRIPLVIFINKTDREGADTEKVLIEIHKELGLKCFPLVITSDDEEKNTRIIDILKEKEKQNYEKWYLKGLEDMAEINDNILDAYLSEQTLADETIIKYLKKHTAEQEICPLIAGSSKYGMGITHLLNAIIEYIPPSKTNKNNLSALVYRIRIEDGLGRLAHIRIFEGKLAIRDKVIINRSREGKISRIKKAFAGKEENISELQCGDCGIIAGLPEIQIADIIGSGHAIPEFIPLQSPVMTAEILPLNKKDFTPLAHAMEILNIEDPSLNLKWYREESQLHISIMGYIQMEIIQAILKGRFNINATFGKPLVVYKETIAEKISAYASYTMPKPCWAVVKFLLEPGKRGSGITYHSMLSTDKIKQKYQNEIEKAIPMALEQGIKGWEVTDLKITLIDGEDHEIHSRPGDFLIAVPMALMQGLADAETRLLEPIMDFTIVCPDDLLGAISSDLHKMRAVFESPVFDNTQCTIHGQMPAATSMDYGIQLAAMSKGKAKLRMKFNKYQACDDEHGIIKQYRGVNPLDTSQWILHARGAFKADERK